MTLDKEIILEIERLVVNYNNVKGESLSSGHNVMELHAQKLQQIHLDNYERIKTICASEDYDPTPYIQLYSDKMNGEQI